MTNYIRVGQRGSSASSYFVSSKTVKGEPVLRLDTDRDRSVDTHDPAVVVRKQTEAGDWTWTPSTDPQEVVSFLNSPQPGKGDDVGLWTDSRKHLFWGPDGKVQESEVQTFTDRWQSEHREGTDTHWNSEYGQNSAWFTHYSTVDPKQVAVHQEERHNGTLTVLDEPRVITRTHAKEVSLWGLYGNGWRPARTVHHDFR